jgi:hypothetical protein
VEGPQTPAPQQPPLPRREPWTRPPDLGIDPVHMSVWEELEALPHSPIKQRLREAAETVRGGVLRPCVSKLVATVAPPRCSAVARFRSTRHLVVVRGAVCMCSFPGPLVHWLHVPLGGGGGALPSSRANWFFVAGTGTPHGAEGANSHPAAVVPEPSSLSALPSLCSHQ